MDWTQAQINARSTGLSSVQSKLVALRTATQGLRDLSTWGDTQTVESTDAKVGVRRTGAAAAGGATVEVLALARAEQRTYAWSSPAADTTLTIGSLSVPVEAGMSLADVVSRVNGASGSPVYASNVNGELVLTARATGAASAFTASGPVTEDATRARAGQDASFRVDGGTLRSSASNVVADGLPGIELTLKGVTSDPASVVVGVAGPDQTLVTSRLQAFVTAYNEVVRTTRSLTEEARVIGASNATDYAKGALRGDSQLTTMLTQLRRSVGDGVSGLPAGMDALADLGVSTGSAGTSASSDARAGILVLDTAKLTTALADPQAVRRLLGGVTGADGVAQRIETALGDQVGSRGIIGKRLGETTVATSDLSKAMTREDQRLAAVEARYKKQFAAMETALANAQSQGNWLSGQLAALAG